MKLIGWGLLLLAIVTTALVPVANEAAATDQTKEDLRAALAGEQPTQVASNAPLVWGLAGVLVIAAVILLGFAYTRPKPTTA